MIALVPKSLKTVPMDKPIYLDYQAATPVDPRVREAMLPWLGGLFGNPHAAHSYGQQARQAIEQARGQVAALLGARGNEIIFTSGATEANNLAIKGAVAFQNRHDGRKRHVITLATEHKSVLESCADVDVTILPVQPDGLLDVQRLKAAIREDTLLVSVMAVNNEIGVIQPLAEIGAICRERGVYFHTDAAQAFGKIPLDVDVMHIDLLSISGHKAYAPSGVGALYIRRKPRVWLEPLFSGGGQERGLRPGTVATPLVVALGEAARVAAGEMNNETAHMRKLRDSFLQLLEESGHPFRIHGSMQRRYAGNLNLSFDGVESSALLARLPQLACSTSSACNSASGGVSHVLQAIGCETSAIRLGFGRFTTQDEVRQAADMLLDAQKGMDRLRKSQ